MPSQRENNNASVIIGRTISSVIANAENEVVRRSYLASNELRNASQFVLRGRRSGKVYRVPYTSRTYRASKEGESPAVRTGVFRLSWGTRVHVEKHGNKFKTVSSIESGVKAKNHLLGNILEYGTSKIAPRPYKQKVIDRALPKIKNIYGKPYS